MTRDALGVDAEARQRQQAALESPERRHIRFGHDQNHARHAQDRTPIGRELRADVRQDHIEVVLRHIDDALQRRHRDGLPFFRLQGAAQNFQFGFVSRQQAGEEVAVETIQIFDGVANAETRMQIEQQMGISQRTREIKQHDALLRAKVES